MKPILRCLVGGLIIIAGAIVAKADTKINASGATFPAPIYQKWIADYTAAHPDVKIDYAAIGSGGGIKGIADKTVDFGASDAPLSDDDKKKIGADVVQIPTVAGAVVVAYNLPDFTGELKLDGPTLANIYLGKITKWNDAKIAELNPGVQLPDLAITPIFRTDGSGTNYIFTNFLATQSDEFLEKPGTGKTVNWPVGNGGKGSQGVTQVLQATKGGIAYVEIAYADQNKIPYATMKNHDGKFIKPSMASVSAAGAGAVKNMDKSLAVDIWDQPGDEAYPIASFTYIIVYKDLSANINSPDKAKVLVDFLKWATSDGEKLAGDLDYAPLAPEVQAKVADAIGSLTYNGKAVAEAK